MKMVLDWIKKHAALSVVIAGAAVLIITVLILVIKNVGTGTVSEKKVQAGQGEASTETLTKGENETLPFETSPEEATDVAHTWGENETKIVWDEGTGETKIVSAPGETDVSERNTAAVEEKEQVTNENGQTVTLPVPSSGSQQTVNPTEQTVGPQETAKQGVHTAERETTAKQPPAQTATTPVKETEKPSGSQTTTTQPAQNVTQPATTQSSAYTDNYTLVRSDEYGFDYYTDGTWEFSFFEYNGTISVELCYYYGNSSNVTVPSEFGGCPVVFVGEAFENNQDVHNVTIPACVEMMFGTFLDCHYLDSVTIANGSKMSYIAEDVFIGCYSNGYRSGNDELDDTRPKVYCSANVEKLISTKASVNIIIR